MTTVLAAACIILYSDKAKSQVINFDVPGGESGGANYSGQGAYPDIGHNYWNPIVPNGTTSAGTNDDGFTRSAITFTEAQSGDYNDGGPGTQGSPSGLQTYFAYANNSATQTCTLNHVPAGAYNLYLYGINGGSGDCDRGSIFTVSSDLAPALADGTINTTAAFNTFIQGNDYVVFTNVLVGPGGTITIKYTHNPAATGVSGNTEGDFNGLQLINLLPDVSISPTLANAPICSSTQLVASVSGVMPFSYQWQEETNGVFVNSTDEGDVSGSMTNILNFSAISIGDAGSYRLVVTNIYGAATSEVVAVTVNLSPVFNVQPVSATLLVRGSYQLTATALGGLPLFYQWQKGTNGVYVNSTDGGDVSGSMTNVLNFSGVSLSDTADYRLIATNSYGSATSQIATVSVVLQLPVGATVPFTEYEAEAGLLGGGATIYYLTNPPTTEFSSPELEASGHAFVQLAGTGQFVQWTNNTGNAVTTLNIRYSIPDSPGGGGISNTIDLYVDGIYRGAVPVNSYQTWVYETASSYNGMSQSPAAGNAHVFWDEVAFFVPGGAIPAGSTITLQQDSDNTASYYNIDLVDLETPAAPLTQPANSLSIITYGAVSNNPSVDNTSALQNCINAAQSQGKSVWIPPGTFYVNPGSAFQVNGITIQGAGPWYSEILNVSSAWTNAFIFNASSTSFRNFCIDATKPNSTPGEDAFTAYGNNWTIDNVWARHLMLTWGTGNNIAVENSRVNNSWGDGININNDNGTACTDVTISNNFVRGCGDDSIAINSSDASAPQMANCTVVNNTTVASWWANQLAIYGGTNILFLHNLLRDSVKEGGIHIDSYANGSSLDNITVQGNTVLRAGGLGYGINYPAIGISGGQTETNVTISDNNIVDCMFAGVQIGNVDNLTVSNNTIIAPGFSGITIQSASIGNGELDDNVVSDLSPGQPMYYNGSSSYTVSTRTDFVQPPTEAASYNNLSSVSAYLEPCSEGGEDLRNLYNGDYVVYSNLDLNGINTCVARVASANAGGDIQIYLDSPTGTLIGDCAVTNTGGWQTWETAGCNVSGASGYHNVYLVFIGCNGVLCSLKWFAFLGNGNRIEAASDNSGAGIQTENSAEGGLDMTNISNGSYAVYHQINLTGAATFNARVASAGAGGAVQIRLDATNGTLVGTCAVSPTSGWQTWSTANCSLSAGASGYHDVYLVFTGGTGDLFNLEWVQFQYNSTTGVTSDLALDQPVTVSSTDGPYPAANAVDGNLNTRWSSAYSDPQWIYVDLGGIYNITGVTLVWEDASAKAYQLQVSTNASTWTTIYSETNGVGGTENITGLTGSGRYVRMYGTQRNSVNGVYYGYSIWEFEVFGNSAEPSVATRVPLLSVEPVSAAQGLTLQWPDNGNRELASQPDIYYTPGLAPVTWTQITPTLVYSNGQWMTTLPATNSQGFYMLQQ